MKEYGLIGYPLKHSFSHDYFTRIFNQENIDAQYINFELEDIDQLMEMIAENPDLQGFNVTIPYKETILPFLDEISEEATRVGAVNVVRINRINSRTLHFIGYNTDCQAFKETLEPLKLHGKKALILGTGGASKAVAAALDELDILYKKVSRTPSNHEVGYDNLETIINDYYLIVNTTPVGTFPNVNESPSIPYHCLTPDHLCYDLIYNPEITEFLRQSAAKGTYIKNGLEMLYRQANLARLIWRI